MTTLSIPFGATSTAADVLGGVDVSGKRAIVTGGASGIGAETARALAHAGAEGTIAARDVEAGGLVARDIVFETGNQSIQVVQLELTEEVSLRNFAAPWLGPLDIPRNDAG